MMFPPNFLHNRISTHYIEINHIFAVEMIKKYQVARKEIIAERDAESLAREVKSLRAYFLQLFVNTTFI